MILKLSIVLGWYFAVCVVRWRIARHYCQGFRLLGPFGLRECWELLSEVEPPWEWALRGVVILPLLVAAII